MPTTIQGLNLSDALLEAAAYAPISRAMLSCYEIWHPTMDEPIRLVRDFQDFTGTLEADAPRDPNTPVLHHAANFRFTRPEESDQSESPRVTLTIDNVAGAVSRALARARGSRDLWEVIERLYASDSPARPAVLPPLRVNLTDVQVTGVTVVAQAAFADPVNVSVPTRLFTPEKYAGLVAK